MILFDRNKRKKLFFDLCEISNVLSIFYGKLAKMHKQYAFVEKSTEKLPFMVRYKFVIRRFDL